jgi:tetratricopeptide (TPR) repeat protein
MPMPQPGQPGQTMAQALASANEKVWLQIGDLSQTLGDLEVANNAYERALHFNQWSVPAMLAISCILRSKDQFNGAVEYLRQILKVDMNNGEVWSSLGHCYLMMDDLQQAYSAYQQALYHLPDPKEPKLWYGIGILYDRYGSLEHAEEAFSQVMRMEPTFEKANEIYFRLGIIYKQQQKFESSLDVSGADHIQRLRLTITVFQIHRERPTSATERRRYLLPDWSCTRTTKRRKCIVSAGQRRHDLTETN